VATLAGRYFQFKNFMFMGRGINYPVALEGALKLKEVSYIHAEGISAGALKHGPIALLDRDFPVVAICTDSATRDKMASNVHEVAARGAPVLALVTEGDHRLDQVATDKIEIPAGDEAAVAILNTVVLQLFAYHVATLLGRNVDQPRNLAKSVTVE
jgi:glucosamine--fructose-6-phosphate aminotransferase (isomerizing)